MTDSTPTPPTAAETAPGTAAAQGVDGPDGAAPSSTSDDQARRRKSRLRLLAGLGVLLLALTAATTVLGLRALDERRQADHREDALRYAKQMAINLTSISAKDLDNDIAQVLDGATGEFEEDFASRSGNLREVLTANDVSSEGKVLEAALVRSDEETATALVVVDTTVRNAANPDGGFRPYRMKLELERQGDRWLTSLLEFVG